MSGDPYLSLLGEGFLAPDTVSEVHDAEGRIARIERHPSYPGAKRVYLDPPASETPFQARWRLPASSTRPDFYPAEFPFIPALLCDVIEAEDRVQAVWVDETGPRISSDERKSFFSSLPPELSELAASVKQSSAQGMERASEFAKGLKALKDRGVIWSEGEAEGWLAGVSRREALEDRFIQAFETALGQMTEAGWVEEPANQDPSSAVRFAYLTRGDRGRQLRLMATFGMGTLTLTERLKETFDSA